MLDDNITANDLSSNKCRLFQSFCTGIRKGQNPKPMNLRLSRYCKFKLTSIAKTLSVGQISKPGANVPPQKLFKKQSIKAWLKNSALVIFKCKIFNIEFVL